MKKVDARKNLPKKGCARGTPPPTYSNFVYWSTSSCTLVHLFGPCDIVYKNIEQTPQRYNSDDYSQNYHPMLKWNFAMSIESTQSLCLP